MKAVQTHCSSVKTQTGTCRRGRSWFLPSDTVPAGRTQEVSPLSSLYRWNRAGHHVTRWSVSHDPLV